MSLLVLFSNFRADVIKAQNFITRAFTVNATGTSLLTAEEKSFVVDSAFLKIFLAWEGFLEKSFVHYVLGAPSSTGRMPNRHATPPSEEHARSMLIGTQKYVDWANPEIVRKLSTLYLLNGDPIESVISSIQVDLFDIKTIRNAAAHLTSSTGRPLDALASRKLGVTVSNISVSDFILRANPSNTNESILDYYIRILDIGADNIANWT